MSSRGKLWGCQIFREEGLPPGWEYVPVGELLDLEYGAALSEEKRVPGPIPVYGSSGVVGSHNEAFVSGPGIVVGRKGTIGAVTYVPTDFWPIDTTYWVQPKRDGNKRYLEALLDYLKLGRLNAATGVPGLSRRDALALSVFLAPPNEQAAIARILDATDTAIKRAHGAAEKANRVRFGLLQRMLGSGLNGHGSQATKVGPVPKNWDVSTVGQEFEVSTGFTLGEHRKPKVNRRRYLRVANVQRGFIKLDDVSELEARDYEMEERTLAVDDLLVVEGHADPKQIGRCAIVLPEAAGLTFQNHLFRLRPKRVLPKFGEIWLNGLQCQLYWQRTCATSSGLNTINQRKLKALPIAVPSPDEQQQVVELATAAETTCRAVKIRLAALERLKRGLMQDLLTGRVRVKAAESLIAATA